MISAKAEEKIKNFYKVVEKMQASRKKEPALLVIKKENLSDIVGLATKTNLLTVIELNESLDIEETIGQLADSMKNGRIVLFRLHEYLDPKIYNQLYLLAQDGHMEYPLLEERIFVDAKKEAQIIIISTDVELEKLNYRNMLDLASVVERL